MIHAQDRSFIGVGVFGDKPYQALRGVLEIGNSHTLALQHTTEQRSLPNYRTGIGNNNSQSRVTAVTGSFTLHDVTPANLALFLNAKVVSVAAGPVSGEKHPVGGLPRELIVFRNLVDATAPVTLTVQAKSAVSEAALGNTGDGAITPGSLAVSTASVGAYTVTLTSATEFVVTDSADEQLGTGTVGAAFDAGGIAFLLAEGTIPFAEDDAFTLTVTEGPGSAGEQGVDYIITQYGIQLTEQTTLPAGEITVSYTKLAADVTEVLAQASPGERTMHFAGMNDAQSGEPFDITLHRVKPNVIAELPVSAPDYAALSVTFELLQDTTRVGKDLSQFYTIRQLKRG